jgi:hypothetical protein
MEFYVRNVNEAFPLLWHYMNSDETLVQDSRNGPVRVCRGPMTITYTQPRERVLFHPVRDCNPFFHLFESIWMLAGRNEVAWLAKFLPRMMEFSDDGRTLVSAYGQRWNEGLPAVVDNLLRDRTTRRGYVPIFFPSDCWLTGKDVPCNVGVSFQVREKEFLDMTVFNRSNDMVWGALGANVVHFSFLHEFVAVLTDLTIGHYSQVSANFHLYTEFDISKRLQGKVQPAPHDPYALQAVSPPPFRIINNPTINSWLLEARYFIDHYTHDNDPLFGRIWSDDFFHDLAAPMYDAWNYWKIHKDLENSLEILERVKAEDWKMAATVWLQRRAKVAERVA